MCIEMLDTKKYNLIDICLLQKCQELFKLKRHISTGVFVVYIDNGTPVITFHQNQDIRRISRFNVALFTTKTVNTKTVLPEIP